uniref:Uncharacterized protein n=1 Tax=Hyaloperonospora arabidopsidis (strain Emoy2) TaxID=559515 RepID=M4BNH5_HYAAE
MGVLVLRCGKRRREIFDGTVGLAHAADGGPNLDHSRPMCSQSMQRQVMEASPVVLTSSTA